MYVYTDDEKKRRAELFKSLKSGVLGYSGDDLRRIALAADRGFEEAGSRWTADRTDPSLEHLRHLDYLVAWRASQLLSEMERRGTPTVGKLLEDDNTPHPEVNAALARTLALLLAEQSALAH